MSPYFSYIVLHILICIAHAKCMGTFFKLTADSILQKFDEQFITSDVLDCDREKLCKTVVRTKDPIGTSDDRKQVVLSITKSTGMLLVHILFCLC